MKVIGYIIIALFLIPIIWYILMPQQLDYVSKYNTKNIKSDPYRDVYRFDWDTYEYIYMDEVNRDYKEHFDPDHFMIDQAVIVLGQSGTQNIMPDGNYIIIDKQRYLYRILPGGEVELRKAR